MVKNETMESVKVRKTSFYEIKLGSPVIFQQDSSRLIDENGEYELVEVFNILNNAMSIIGDRDIIETTKKKLYFSSVVTA
ncbi:MAG: hypothetical protein LUK37_12620 [Clostridia bacterium]|nr:hypothetical protein [Clostridia bacterium]